MSRNFLHLVASRTGKSKRRLVLLGGGLSVVAVCVAVRYWWPADVVSAKAPSTAASLRPASPAKNSSSSSSAAASRRHDPQIVAVVNGHRITRTDLARECLWHYGQDVLESLVNKTMIAEHCRTQNIDVTQQEVKAEIERMAERFGIPTDQWLKMLQEERDISPAQYAADIVWPTLALRKLAETRVEPTPEEVQQAYETQFGPSVKCRLIVCGDLTKAQRVRAAAMANPDDFGNLAKQHSEDSNSASAKGLIQPIRRHVGDPQIEQTAFAMNPGEISEIIGVGDQYVILKCEAHLPARQVPRAQVEKTLEEAVRDKKLRLASAELLDELQQSSVVEIFFGDPEKESHQPGVAAAVNGRPVTTEQLAEECIERHGAEVVEGVIHRTLLEQAVRRNNITITQQDVDKEVARAAVAMGKTKGPGNDQPDVDAWLQEVTQVQGISIEQYVHDVVWPSVTLKKLVDGQVQVTDEDLRKGYEANYGPRVRCRAIVFIQLRQAQEVWEMARKNPTVEFFGDLAEQYSVEASTRVLKGEVPPIKRHGGQPQLEREAFELQEGELSSIVQVRDKYVILLCEGYTKPRGVEFSEVRDLIYEDIYEKKLRIAMARRFGQLQSSAQIDNYVAGTSQSPSKDQSVQEGSPQSRSASGQATTSAASARQTLPR